MSGRDGAVPAGYPGELGRGMSALDDMLRSLSSDRRSLFGVLSDQQIDRAFAVKVSASEPGERGARGELLVDFSARVRATLAAAANGSGAGFRADGAAGLIDRAGSASRTAMTSLVASVERAGRGGPGAGVSVADALACMFVDGYLLANHEDPRHLVAGENRVRARELAAALYGPGGIAEAGAWAPPDGGEPGCGEGPAVASAAQARAEALEAELAAARAELARRDEADAARVELLDVLRLSGNLSFETAGDAVAFAAEALPDRLAFARGALRDAGLDADAVWRAVRALAFDFQPAAALGRPPVRSFDADTGFTVSLAGAAVGSASLSGRIGRTEQEAGYVLRGPSGPDVHFTVMPDGRVAVLAITGGGGA